MCCENCNWPVRLLFKARQISDNERGLANASRVWAQFIDLLLAQMEKQP